MYPNYKRNKPMWKDKKVNRTKIMIYDEILERYQDEELLIADGFNKAIIGIEDKSLRLIYSVKKCLEILQKDMSYEEASEYFDFNVSGAYVGEKTPIWCYDDF